MIGKVLAGALLQACIYEKAIGTGLPVSLPLLRGEWNEVVARIMQLLMVGNEGDRIA